MTATNPPARRFADGTAVTFPHNTAGYRQRSTFVTMPGTVTGATTVGVRHPGHIYDVACEDGVTRYVADGLLTEVR